MTLCCNGAASASKPSTNTFANDHEHRASERALKQRGQVDAVEVGADISRMTRRLVLQALMLGAIGFGLSLTGCTTVETRIAERPEAFRRLSPTDQTLVQQGRVRDGMSRDAVYIAWGPPSQRVPGRNR